MLEKSCRTSLLLQKRTLNFDAKFCRCNLMFKHILHLKAFKWNFSTLWHTIRISDWQLITMQLNSKAIFVAYLLFLSLCDEGKLIISKPRERIQILMCISQVAFIQRREFHDINLIMYHSGSSFTYVVCPATNLLQTALYDVVYCQWIWYVLACYWYKMAYKMASCSYLSIFYDFDSAKPGNLKILKIKT